MSHRHINLVTPEPEPTEREVRDIVGASYDHAHGYPPERFQTNRPLTITAIPNDYERSLHVVIAINGSPCRGMALVPTEDTHALAIDLHTRRQFTARQTEVLRRFALNVRSDIGGGASNHWTWSSMTPTTSHGDVTTATPPT